jgi:serine protease Do
MLKHSWKTVLFVAALLGTIALAVAPAFAEIQARSVNSVTDFSGALATTARQAGPAVVQIFTTSYVPRESRAGRAGDLLTTQRASGSGVIVDSDGYIVTNAHVLRGANRLRVELPIPVSGSSILAANSRAVSAQLVGVDLETDLAVIKVEENNLTALAFGDSDELRNGQIVLALGSPLGLHNSVSLGVISAVARQLEPESPMIYIQTDASINPGSSGGPLVDLHGRIVGINTMIISQAGGNEGLSFSAPSNIVRTVYEQIRKSGRVLRGDIGVRAQTLTPVLAAGLQLGRYSGVLLSDVTPGSPAARAGLRPGDLVLGLDGKPLENGRQFQVRLYRYAPGDVVSLDILRDGQSRKVSVAIIERPEPAAGFAPRLDPAENLVPRLGILGLNLDSGMADMLPALRVRSGVLVAATVEGPIDAPGGLQAGDIIYAVNRTFVAKLSELQTAVEELKPGDAVVLHLERRGELLFLGFTID